MTDLEHDLAKRTHPSHPSLPLLGTVTECQTSNLQDEKLILLIISNDSVYDGGEGMAELCSLPHRSQEAKNGDKPRLLHFSLFSPLIPSRPWAEKTVLPNTEGIFPLQAIFLWKYPHTHK